MSLFQKIQGIKPALVDKTGSTSTKMVVIDTDGSLGTDTYEHLKYFTESQTTTGVDSTINVSTWTPKDATACAVVLAPIGVGGLMGGTPDGTSTGGNARGNYAVDWQLYRSVAVQVASGLYATIGGGENNTASNTASTVAGGDTNNASGNHTTIAGGSNNIASGDYSSCSGGIYNTSGSTYSQAGGYYAKTSNVAQRALASGRIAKAGDAQGSDYVLYTSTLVSSGWIELFLSGSSSRIVLNDLQAIDAFIQIIVRDDGYNCASFERRCLIKRDVGAASTTLISTVQTIGTDIKSTPMATADVLVTADTTNGSLKIQALTPASGGQYKIVARVTTVEISF